MSNAPSAAIRHGRSSLTRFDLEDRFIEFAVQVCDLAQRLPSTPVGKHVASQLIRSATSPLANYGEAQGAESRRDFVHKLRVCLKELRETSTWLKFSLRMKSMRARGGGSCDKRVRRTARDYGSEHQDGERAEPQNVECPMSS